MKTVLIVDDNIKNLDLFKDFVESWGYETVTAQQGKDAISLAERYLPLASRIRWLLARRLLG